MSERYGKCPHCNGRGFNLVMVTWLGIPDELMCGTCMGTGFWGGAFPPQWTPEELE
jgi:DnaJ-class molecular chaperone